MPGLHCRFRPSAYLRRWVAFRFLSSLFVFLFEILISHLFDVIRHSPHFEEEDDL